MRLPVTRQREQPVPEPAGKVGAFFGITFAVTWAAWFAAPLVDATGGDGHSAAWTLLIYVGTFAPGIAAVAISALEGPLVVRDLLRRLVKGNVAVRWYVFAIAFMFTVKLANAAIQRVAFGAWPAIAPEPIPLLLAATVISTPSQAGEELGWRGFALPRLVSRVGCRWAAIVVGIVWALWHLPLFLIPGIDKTGQSFPVWALGVVAMSVAMTWLWVKTGGSLLLTMLMHAAVNNLGSIVPSAVPGATNIWTFHAAPGLWITTGLLWACAVWFLTQLPNRIPRADAGVSAVAVP